MIRAWAAVAAVIGSGGPAPAQVFWGPGGTTTFGYRSGFGVGFAGPRFGFAAGFSQSFVSTTQVYGPVVARPWGWGPWPPPPVVVVPVVVPVAAIVPPVRQPAADPPDIELPAAGPKPRIDRADFVVVRPARAPDPLPPAGAPKRLNQPFALVPNLGAGGFPAPVVPPVDPKARAVFEVAEARTAFAAGEYGRAAERLRSAGRADPASPVPHFLLAQAHTARGEYAEAVAAIRDGMQLSPDWPASGFRPRELYGPVADRFDAHFADLRAALAARPDDPALQFLVAYFLWFSGDRAEAAKLFRKAAGAVKDGGLAERFLTEFEGKKA